MKTSDNYFVKLKGFVETTTDVDEQTLLSSVSTASQSHLSSISLMDALDLVNTDQSALIKNKLAEFDVTTFKISTVDAVQGEDPVPIVVDIDPNLENQKQSKGIIGRLRSMFGR